MKKILYAVMLCFLVMPAVAPAEQDIAVRVAVMPFESFSGDQKTSVGRDVAVKLLQQLSTNPLMLTPDVQDMQPLFSREEPSAPSEDRLREVAKLLNVNFLLFGSVTRVKDIFSVDAQVFYNFPGDNYFKTYAEGPDFDKVVEELSRKIEQELLDKASLIPAAQRVRGKAGKRHVAAAGEPDAAEYEKVVSREIAAEEETEESELREGKHAGAIQQEDFTDEELVPRTPAKAKTKAAEEAGDSERKRESSPMKLDQPVNINADSLEYSNKDNSAVFRGNVVARQGDMTMFADLMEVTYGGKTGDKSERGGIKQLVASGNVKIIQGERVATGQKIVFYGDEQKIVATGEPRVWQGSNVIVGNKITVYLRQDRSVVEGNPKERVSATIYPKEKKGKKP